MDGQPCTGARRTLISPGNQYGVQCALPSVAVGYKNVTVTIANRVCRRHGSRAAPRIGAHLSSPCLVRGWRTMQTGFLDADSAQSLLVVCSNGYFGRTGEVCLKCPASIDGRAMASCPGYVTGVVDGSGFNTSSGRSYYPIPLTGFYDLNGSMASQCPPSSVIPGRDVCIVACSPPEACAGGN